MTMNRRRFLEVTAALGASVALPALGCQTSQRGRHADGADAGDTGTSEGSDAATEVAEMAPAEVTATSATEVTPDTTAPETADVPDVPDTGDGLPTYSWDGPPGPENTFECGVASGDPLPAAVLLWTRVSKEDANDLPVAVFLEVASDEVFAHRIAATWVSAEPDRDYTVVVDQGGLAAGTTYYYRFSAQGRTSPVGRTRTAPTGSPESLRLGVVSCSAYGWGYFHAYRHLTARTELDAIVHLGDYIYEHAADGFGKTYGTVRPYWPPNEIVTLADYRARYWSYRKDPDLQELHRLFPIIHIWDDHEFANDPKLGGAGNHQPATEGLWSERVAAALRAYGEWMPSRLRENGGIFRTLDFGTLARLTLVDRQRRFLFPAEGDEGYLGTEQGAWLDAQIAATTSAWFLFGSGTRFASRAADGVGESSWDHDSRRRVLDALAANGRAALVALTGDTHRFDALDVVEHPTSGYDPVTGAGSEGVELVCGSVTSPGSAGVTEGIPQYLWTDPAHRGYLILGIAPERIEAEFWGFPDAAKESAELPVETRLKAYTVARTGKHLVGG